jgi:hypothetical protein
MVFLIITNGTKNILAEKKKIRLAAVRKKTMRIPQQFLVIA